MKGNEVKPQEGGSSFHQVDRKKESNLQGNRIKLHEGFAGFQLVHEKDGCEEDGSSQGVDKIKVPRGGVKPKPQQGGQGQDNGQCDSQGGL